ncbi:zf-U1-domain-containing protein [Hesseltinella vesiculosa]|uniref:U1 small nuclear ribonucleoprotein C n=1 Tax=Hesseltinella vesiculosa TaxID=101127 RepID=A0A1X2GGZ2_9FUNG|nr:zf-U1-domain-containing protein [Hesseltinella vesiculosa]
MPKYYCEYCDVYLTHDSPSVRKGHNAGRNHIANVRQYYSEIPPDQSNRILHELTHAYEVRGELIPPQYTGAFVPGFGPPVRPPFPGVRPGFPPFGNMSTVNNRPPRPPFYGGPRPPMPPPPGYGPPGYAPPPPSGYPPGPPPPHSSYTPSMS